MCVYVKTSLEKERINYKKGDAIGKIQEKKQTRGKREGKKKREKGKKNKV